MTTIFVVSFTHPNEETGQMEQTTTYYEDASDAQEAFNAHLEDGWDFARLKEQEVSGVGIDAGLNYCAVQGGTKTLTISTIDLNREFDESQVIGQIQLDK